MKLFMYTPEQPHSSDVNWMFMSTDTITCCKYRLGPGNSFDPVDVHAGDEAYYVIKGCVTMFNPGTGQVVELKQGEAILMPKGAPHKAYNFTAEEAEMLAVIAPQIWVPDGPPDSYDDKMKTLKYDR